MPASLEAVQNELGNIAKDIGEIKHSQKNIQTSLDGQRDRLTRIETQMEERNKSNSEAVARAFAKIDQQDARLQKMELEQPLTQFVRGIGLKIIAGIVVATAIPTAVQLYIAMKSEPSRAVVNERTVTERTRTPVEEPKP